LTCTILKRICLKSFLEKLATRMGFKNWHGCQFLNRLTVCDLEKYLKSVYLAASESDDEKTNERAFGKDFAALYFGKGK